MWPGIQQTLNKSLLHGQREAAPRRMVLSLEDISKEVIPKQGLGRYTKIRQVEGGGIFYVEGTPFAKT